MEKSFGDLLNISELSQKTGLAHSRLRYLEARFPSLINNKLSTDGVGLYSVAHIETFKQLDDFLSEPTANHLMTPRLCTPKKVGKVLTFASGKGGVGKTSLSLNLAILAAAHKFKTVLIDGDLGMANGHTLLGLRPEKTLEQVLTQNIPLTNIFYSSHYGLTFIPGGAGIVDLANSDKDKLAFLAKEFRNLRHEFDWVILDSPAGLGDAVLEWVNVADELVIVTTTAPTSLLDAYGLIKTAKAKGFSNPIKVIINMVETYIEGESIYNKLNQCTEKFLNLSLDYLGSIQRDLLYDKAIVTTRPVSLGNRKLPAFKNIYKVGKNLFTK